MDQQRPRVGVIGCGDVANTRYLPYLAGSAVVDVVACADLEAEKAKATARRFGLDTRTAQHLLEADDVDIVLNLTPPLVHFELNSSILSQGKHVYSEKPFAATFDQGKQLNRLAHQLNLHLASAPDTILGPNIQLARQLIDAGKIGRPYLAAMSFVTTDRSWHPNPEFFYREGAGPIFDEAPYFLSALVALLGPIAEVQAYDATFRSEIRLRDAVIRPEVPSSYVAILRLSSGVLVTLLISFEVRGTTQPPFEIYGEEGTLRLGFPGFFNGPVLFGTEHNRIDEVIEPTWRTAVEDARGLGLEELALSIREQKQSRLEGDFPLHILEAMEAIVTAGRTGKVQKLTTQVSLPEPYLGSVGSHGSASVP